MAVYAAMTGLEATVGLPADRPEVVITVFADGEGAPGVLNRRDHIEFAAAFAQACNPPRWLFTSAIHGTHYEVVDDYVGAAVASLASHEQCLTPLDPHTSRVDQARRQIERALPVHDALSPPSTTKKQRTPNLATANSIHVITTTPCRHSDSSRLEASG